MEQYIPKSALLAEIERLVNNYDKALDYEAALEDVRDFIDSIEVKEVGIDFGDPEGDKSAICIVDTKKFEVKEVDLDFTKEVDMWIGDNEDSNGFFNVQELAKHFFELGLTVSNKAQKGE